MSSNITTLNRKKGNIKAQIAKLSNWKERNDLADIAAHLTVLEKLQKKFDDIKTEYFESATDEEILEIEISLAEMDSVRAALKGETKNIETSDDTFQSLFKALDERYENKRLIVDKHIKNIVNYDKLTQKLAKDLRRFLDCITKKLKSLKNIKL
ncbi:DUF1758 domain-containing protein [Nephila pilipes]|uniref:DUF1758 domain-containing protein n=1 Tax=Nephila pilipes TaxID=299642 RepID=A0A8X6MYP0_NEPPI|nr:DUF1758 domain-containing protein [Nephila pilipes]